MSERRGFASHRDESGRLHYSATLRAVRFWLGFAVLVGGLCGSIYGGMVGLARHIVPPIAQEAIKPVVDDLRATDARLADTDLKLAATDARLETAMRAGDEATVAALRSEMSDLRASLRDSQQLMGQLLLQLAAKRRGEP